MDILQRLNRVTDYIHDHLADDLDLATLARVACMSPCHWHRVYHAAHGETIAATVRRVRLQRASGHLAHSSLPVADIARRCGYPNAQSFSRAFRSDYGVSPSQYRRHGGHTLFRAPPPAGHGAGFEVKVAEVPAVRLAGVAHQGDYMLIGKAFEAVRAQFIGHKLLCGQTRWLAEYFDDPASVAQKHLRSRAGLSLLPGISAMPPLIPFELGGGLCAVLRYRGPYASMHAAYRWLYGRWLLDSAHQVADAPVFEEYLNSPHDTAPADLITDIFLPLSA